MSAVNQRRITVCTCPYCCCLGFDERRGGYWGREIVVLMGILANFKQHLPPVFPLERSSHDWCSPGAFPSKIEIQRRRPGVENTSCLWVQSKTAAYLNEISNTYIHKWGKSVFLRSEDVWALHPVLPGVLLSKWVHLEAAMIWRRLPVSVISCYRHESREEQSWHDGSWFCFSSGFYRNSPTLFYKKHPE